MSREKIIVLTHEFAPFRGGAAIYAQEIAAAMFQLGHDVDLWAPDYFQPNEYDSYPFRVVRLRAGGSLHFLHLVALARALHARSAQLSEATVIPVSAGAHMALMFLSILRSVRLGNVVSLLHGSEVLRFSRNPIWRFLARKFYRDRVRRVATVSEFSKSLIIRSKLLPDKLSIVLAPAACSSDAARPARAINSSTNRLKILTLARVHPRKGQLDVARALSLLPDELRSQIVYQIGGRGDAKYLDRVERTCRKNHVAFEYLGEIAPNDLSDIFTQCDIYAMTSRRLRNSVEGFGITYLEAGFHGKPVVAYRSGGASEAVIDHETGLLVAEGNLQELAETFTCLLRSHELREDLGNGGKQNTLRYDWKTSACILLNSECASP